MATSFGIYSRPGIRDDPAWSLTVVEKSAGGQRSEAHQERDSFLS